MAEYIERDKVIQLLLDACLECKDGCIEFDGFLPDCTQCVMGECKVEILRLPVVDVSPVKHGKWETEICDDGFGAYNLFVCSLCGSESAKRFNYCRECGAKMDGGT